MGILILIKSIEPAQLRFIYNLIICLVLILIIFLFRTFVFKNLRPNGKGAALFGGIGFGLGQAFNGQYIKSIIFLAGLTSLPFLLKYFKVNEADPDNNSLILFGVYVIVIIEGAISAKSAFRKSMNKRKRAVAKVKSSLVEKYIEQGYGIAVDTNVFMHEPAVLIKLIESRPFHLYMSKLVFHELDGLKKSTNVSTRKSAQFAFDVIEEFQKRQALTMLDMATHNERRQFGLGDSSDEKIIATYLAANRKEEHNLIFFSNDKGARIIARNVNMPVVQ